MTAKRMNPAIVQRAVPREGSSPGVWVPIFAARGCVGVSIIVYMTGKICKGHILRAEIPHSFVKGNTLQAEQGSLTMMNQTPRD